MAPTPQEPRCKAAPQHRIAEEALPAPVEGDLVRWRRGRTGTLQLERDLRGHNLNLLANIGHVVVDRRGAGREECGSKQERAACPEEPCENARHSASAQASGNLP